MKAVQIVLAGVAALAGLTTAARAADEALIAAAKKEGVIVWYTVQTIPQIVTPLVAAFEKKYGVKVNYIRANSSEVALRVLNEAKAGRTLSDVFDGTGTTAPLKRAGLVMKWLPDEAKSWPKELIDAEGYWVATNFFVNTVGINTNLVPPAQEPKTWDDVLDPKWKGRMAMGSSKSASAGPGMVGLMFKTRGEKDGREFLRKLAGQDVASAPVAARQILDRVIAGEYAIGLMMFNHHAVISAAQGAPVKWLPVGPAMVTLNVASLTKDAPHPNAGKLFLDYMISEPGQAIFRDTDYLPANPKVKAKDPSLIPDGKKFVGQFFTPEEVDTQMPRWNDIYHEIFR
jgi:ABC-type Fe3+ transport system substrate-binding protein